MLTDKIGNIIRTLRTERGLTQKQLADKMNISDKTVSKWERGMGCPDLSLVPLLSSLLRVDIIKLLEGDLSPNELVGGNMKNSKYFVCPQCGNITLCTGESEISCCGKRLDALEMQKASPEQKLTCEQVENEWFITTAHEMSKEHYISFVAFATGDSVQLVKKYPEWNLDLRLPRRGHGTLIWYCTKHGLFYQLI